METPDINAVELLASIIEEHTPEDIWRDSPLAGYRNLGNTNRGEIGEEFVCRFLSRKGIDVGNGNRTSRTDMTIEDRRFEVKTACGEREMWQKEKPEHWLGWPKDRQSRISSQKDWTQWNPSIAYLI